jgi:hypothetical protein
MVNPFQPYEITINLTTHQIRLIMQSLASSNPDRKDEEGIIQLFAKWTEILKQIEATNEK